MDSLLDTKLVEDFPLLYRERYWNMQQTCMCWGFPGNGWNNLIRDLSSKLEPIIQKYIDDHPEGKCECGCAKDIHSHYFGTGCQTIHRMPYRARKGYGYVVPELWKDLTVRYPKNKRYAIKRWWRNYRRMIQYKVCSFIDRWILMPLFNFHIVVKKRPCKCEEYHLSHPRASQVKEKFGTLSFYMSTGTDEIWKLIDDAELMSTVICENCGKPGVLRGSDWVNTLCDKCAKERGKEKTYKEWVEEKEKVDTSDLVSMMSIVPRKQADE